LTTTRSSQPDVGVAVVVDVADGDAHAPAGHVEARALADVLEAAAGELPIQAVGRFRLGAGVLEQVEIEQAVVVEVEEGDAGAHDLRQEVAVGRLAGVVDEIEAPGGADLGEPRGSRRRVGLLRRAVGLLAARQQTAHGQDHQQDPGSRSLVRHARKPRCPERGGARAPSPMGSLDTRLPVTAPSPREGLERRS
jgi:hypothetical protein